MPERDPGQQKRLSMAQESYIKDISVILSIYNENESLPELVERIRKVMADNGFSYELIMVDDGSRDGSWDTVRRLAGGHDDIKGISFRRNYGKSAALYCGFRAAEGRVVVTMDADLQDSPEEIPEMYRMIAEDGYDIVSGWKRHRKDNALTKNLPSKLYNATARKITGIRLHDMNCGLKAYRNEVVKNIEVYGEMHRYIPYLAKNAGFDRITEKPVHHQKRKYGKSKFGVERFVNGFLDLLSLWFPAHFPCRRHTCRVDNHRETAAAVTRTPVQGRNRPAALLSRPCRPCHRRASVPCRLPRGNDFPQQPGTQPL